MNYVQEMSSFYSWLELNPLSPSSINLWHALMHMQHKAGGKETFTVAESVLCIKTNLTDRTLRKARKELKEKGRLDYVSRQGKAPVYRMIPFHDWNISSNYTEDHFSVKNSSPIAESDTKSELNSGVDTDDFTNTAQTAETHSEFHSENLFHSENITDVHSESHSSSENNSAICSTLFKQQTNKQPHASWADLIETWKSVFGFTIKANHVQILDTYMNHSQMSDLLILEAIDRVKRAAKPALNYLWNILSNWANLGIRTIKDLVIHENNRVHKSKKAPQSHQPYQSRDIPRDFKLDLTEGEEW